VTVRVHGAAEPAAIEAAQAAFTERTGWNLVIKRSPQHIAPPTQGAA